MPPKSNIFAKKQCTSFWLKGKQELYLSYLIYYNKMYNHLSDIVCVMCYMCLTTYMVLRQLLDELLKQR